MHQGYMRGGAARETLELALLETLKTLGPGDHKPDKIRVGGGCMSHHTYIGLPNLYPFYFAPWQACFTTCVVHVKERMEAREQEITGSWLTEERMKNQHSWSK